MSSKKDSSKDTRSTAPSAGLSSIPHLGKSSRPSAVPTRSGVGSASKIPSEKSFEDSSRPPTSYLAQGSNLLFDDIDEEHREKTVIKSSLLGPSRIPAPSVMPTKVDTTRIPAPSKMPTKVDITRIPAPSTVNEAPTTFPNIPSRAPPNTKSVLLTDLDVQMASKQPNFATLTLKEQAEQNNWAQEMIKRVGACPENFDWVRRENPGGYQCEGGGHGMTDELLAEGKGGLMVHATKKWGESKGPYYLDPESGKFHRVQG